MTKDSVRQSAQAEQNQLTFELTIDGNPNWQSFLDETTTFKSEDDFWAKRCGGQTVPLLTYLKVEAEVNDVSLERCVLNTLLSRGFELQELEVEFSSPEQRNQWGICTWYKEHPRYAEPLGGMFKPEAQKFANMIHAVFKTEHAGDQEFGIFSTQMIGAAMLGLRQGILLHKTLLFRKAVLTSPSEKAAAA